MSKLPAFIPYNRPYTTGNELPHISEAIACGHLSGDGKYTRLCQNFLEEQLGIENVLLTTSCTHALEIAALLLDIKPGDEVVVPSFTFVSTVNAFVLRGATPVFVDIRADTLNLDERLLEKSISRRTKAIVPVHYAGVGCEMDDILSIASSHKIPVIEDNAQGIFGKYKSEFLGSMGTIGTLSFHETKNFQCGEGGAILLNNSNFVERAEILREKGTDRSKFFRGEVDKYSWRDLGSSYLPSDILAAFLYAQFEKKSFIQAKRKSIWEFYNKHLASWAAENKVQLPFVPSYCEQSFHLFYMLLPSYEDRQALIAHLRKLHIHSVFHYLPLHNSDMGKSFGGKSGDCPVAELRSSQLIRLPFHISLSDFQLMYIIDSVKEFTCSCSLIS